MARWTLRLSLWTCFDRTSPTLELPPKLTHNHLLEWNHATKTETFTQSAFPRAKQFDNCVCCAHASFMACQLKWVLSHDRFKAASLKAVQAGSQLRRDKRQRLACLFKEIGRFYLTAPQTPHRCIVDTGCLETRYQEVIDPGSENWLDVILR